MSWEPFFEDLEGQLAAEWEAERAALDSEAERLRMSRLAMRDRLRALVGGDPLRIDFADAPGLDGRLVAVGADWLGLEGTASPASAMLVPIGGVSAIGASEAEVLRSARADSPGAGSLAERMPVGFVLRDLARRRVPVRLRLAGAGVVTGTIDRVGADHLDLAVHEPGAPRRRTAVEGFRIIPVTGIRWIGVDAPIIR